MSSSAEIRRKVVLAVAVAEYFLHRPIKSVLDIGSGEGAWLEHLRALRRDVAYTGLDPSEYVVRRFGKKRNIRRAAFGELRSLRLAQKFDLIVCSDVLHYVEEAEIKSGVREIARLLTGVAYIEVLTREDDIVGDLQDMKRRPAKWYRKVLDEAGLMSVAPYCFAAASLFTNAAELENPE